MAAAGWDPRAFARYIEREQPEVAGTARVFSALPPRDERLAALRTLIGDLPPRDYSTSAEFVAVQSEVRRVSAARTQQAVPGPAKPLRK
jgi:predicted Zn-dependent protease